MSSALLCLALRTGRPTNGREKIRGIIGRQLGWDVTEFGQGRFDELGLVLFTLRNGLLEDLERGSEMLYAEKAMIVNVNQVAPMHFHWSKTEDINNRSGWQSGNTPQTTATALDGTTYRLSQMGYDTGYLLGMWLCSSREKALPSRRACTTRFGLRRRRYWPVRCRRSMPI